MFFFTILTIVSSQILASREIVTKNLAEGQLFRVRYNLTNTFEQWSLFSPVYNVTVFDPSFTRQDFLFIEGKSKAKLTWGTMKPNAKAHVDLDMEARKPLVLSLKKAQLTYDLPEEVTEYFEVFNDGQLLEFTSAKTFFISNLKYYAVLAGFLLLGVAPVAYSNHLKKKRIKIFKSN